MESKDMWSITFSIFIASSPHSRAISMQIIFKGHVIDLFMGLIECTPIETGSPERMISGGKQQVRALV